MEAAARKSLPTALPEHLGLAEERRHDFVLDIPINVTLDDVVDPAYWAHVSALMEPLDHVEVRAADGSWVADLIVCMCERNYAKVKVKSVTKLDADTDVPTSTLKHKVEWKGPVNKWSVIRLSDFALIHSGEKAKDGAYAWMQDHEKTLTR